MLAYFNCLFCLSRAIAVINLVDERVTLLAKCCKSSSSCCSLLLASAAELQLFQYYLVVVFGFELVKYMADSTV